MGPKMIGKTIAVIQFGVRPFTKDFTRNFSGSQLTASNRKLPCVEELAGTKHRLVSCCDEEVALIDGRKEPCMIYQPERPKPRVIIVGAGMAGLSAAHRLITRGLDNVLVLEAKPRPGGRIHTCKLGSDIAELGAEYIEGASLANSVFNLAVQEGLVATLPPRIPGADRPPRGKGLVLIEDGPGDTTRAVDSFDRAYRLVKKMKREAYRLFSRSIPVSQAADLKQFFDRLTGKEMPCYFKEEEMKVATKVVDGLLSELKTRWGVASLAQLSASQYGSCLETPGGKIKIPTGTTGLLAPLLRVVPQSAIKYDKVVQNVAWKPNTYGCRALVRCCDGEQFAGDYVVMTVSLGVIKSRADTMFSPRLPKEKRDSAAKLGYGHVEKIYLKYAKPFWDRHEPGPVLHLSGEHREDWSEGVTRVEVSGNAVEISVAGREATLALEEKSDAEVAQEASAFLRRITGDRALPDAAALLRSQWTGDCCFLGATSYLCPGSCVQDQCALGEPLGDPAPVLLFAGEATVPGHSGTLQGARMSGVREADRIASLTIAHGGPPPQEPSCKF